jgi:hypothetical protein
VRLEQFYIWRGKGNSERRQGREMAEKKKHWWNNVLRGRDERDDS